MLSLSIWARNGWIVAHEASAQETGDLLSVAERDLRDSAVESLSADWRLAIAYNAALQCAAAALAASGYRCGREAHHYRIIESLAFTIGADRSLIAKLVAFRKKRNISDYERAGLISAKESAEMIALATQLREDVVQWLRKNHPQLLP